MKNITIAVDSEFCSMARKRFLMSPKKLAELLCYDFRIDPPDKLIIVERSSDDPPPPKSRGALPPGR
jgi:hypothetical protein